MSRLLKNRLFIGVLSGTLLHLFFFVVLFNTKEPKYEKKEKKRLTQIKFIEPKKEPPIAISEKEIESLQQKKAEAKEAPKEKVETESKKESSKKKKTQALAKPKKKNLKVRKFSISMQAVANEGTVSVEASADGESFAFGSLEGDPNAPKKRVIYDASDPSAISSLPVLIRSPSEIEKQRLYPAQAKREGLEANVKLSLLVERSGEVSDVKILEEAGQGFDEAALELAKQFKFEPAQRAGKSVRVWIPWTYKFRLE